jgi:hypothetical protein
MGFVTKLDYSDNRQIKQYKLTNTHLSGATCMGVEYSALTKGVDVSTVGVTQLSSGVVSTFTGTTTATTFYFGNLDMELAADDLVAVTDINSGTTQNAGPSFTGSVFTQIDANLVALEYSGISYDLVIVDMIETAPGEFSGSTISDLTFYSGSTDDYTGSTVWLDVKDSARVRGNLYADFLYGDGSNITNLPGSTNDYTTGTTFIGSIAYFDRTDSLSAYTLDLSTFVSTGDTFTSGVTFNSNYLETSLNNGTNISTLIDGFTGLTVNGTLSATTIDADTILSGGTNLTQIFTNLLTSGDTYVTGTTFVNNELTLSRNDDVNVKTFIDSFTGLTVNGTLSADTIDAGSILSGGTNLLDIINNAVSSGDTFVTGFTYDNANTFTIGNSDTSSYSATIDVASALTITNYIDYTTTSTPSVVSGRTFFDRTENSLSYYPETNNNDVTINIGQESVIRVYNGTGSQINNGQACHITSSLPSVDGVPGVVLAIATGDTSTGSLYEVSGVATHDIPNGEVGFITAFGVVRDLTITGVTEGSEVYLSDTELGGFLYSPPPVEARRSIVGHVITTGTTTAKIIVEITNEIGFFELTNSEIAVIAQNTYSTGVREGGALSVNPSDNSLLDISPGSGIIVDNFTDPNNPTIDSVTWGNITGITITNLTGETGSFIFLDENANPIQFSVTNPPTEADKRDSIYLGFIGHASNVVINNAFSSPIQIVNPVNQHEDLTSAIGPFSINGNRVDNILGTLELKKSSGRSFFYGGNFHNDPKTPSQINTSALSGSTLIYAKGDTVIGLSGTTIDPNNYDSNGLGVITPIPGSNNYVAHRIWHQPTNNLLIFQYGQDFYTNEANARDNFEFENFIVPPGLDEAAYIVAVIIVRDSATDLDSAIIIPQGKFAGTGGGGGGSVDTLQSAYENSTQPEILTDPTRGAVDFRVGSGSDSDQVVTFQENGGAINAFVTGLGDASFQSLSGDGLTTTGDILPSVDASVDIGTPSNRFRDINTVSGTTSVWEATTSVATPQLELGLDLSGNTRTITADNSIIRDDCLNGGSF